MAGHFIPWKAIYIESLFTSCIFKIIANIFFQSIFDWLIDLDGYAGVFKICSVFWRKQVKKAWDSICFFEIIGGVAYGKIEFLAGECFPIDCGVRGGGGRRSRG